MEAAQLKTLTAADSERRQLADLADAASYLLRDTYRAFMRLLNLRIAGEGLRPGMWFFLRVLWQEEGLSQRELSRRIGTTEPTTVTALNGMERRGIIRRQRDRKDKRRRMVFLTEHGHRLRNRALSISEEVNLLSTAGLSAEELLTLADLLGRVRQNMLRAMGGESEFEEVEGEELES